jgi:hypothetical protein
MKIYHIEYTAWAEGARIPVRGEFDLPAASENDARQACKTRWPDMRIERIEQSGDTSNG